MEEWVNISKTFFEDHVGSFKTLTEEQQKNFSIKRDHSQRVANNCKWLATELKLNTDDAHLAYICGLLHDTGRFRQLVDYGTFHDAKSVDHAQLAVQVLKEKDILKTLPEDKQELLLTSIYFHNKFQLPEELNAQIRLFSCILRDADKLDILKILTDYYTNSNKEANHTLTWELPAGSGVTNRVAKEALAGKLVSKTEIKNQIDVKVLQLSWIYDINFGPSFEYILAERFLEKIYNTLPKNDTIIAIYCKAQDYAENKIMAYAKNN